MRKQYDSLTAIDNKGEWIEYLPRQYTVELTNGVRQPQWYMVRVTNLPMHEILSVMAVNLELTNWIYACSANEIKGQSRVWYVITLQLHTFLTSDMTAL